MWRHSWDDEASASSFKCCIICLWQLSVLVVAQVLENGEKEEVRRMIGGGGGSAVCELLRLGLRHHHSCADGICDRRCQLTVLPPTGSLACSQLSCVGGGGVGRGLVEWCVRSNHWVSSSLSSSSSICLVFTAKGSLVCLKVVV
jgi:hypothetical protein